MRTYEAVSDIVRKSFELDDRELLAGLPRLADRDRTWDEWAGEFQARLNYLAAYGPSQDVLNTMGALVVAMKVRLAAADEVDVASGEAA